MNFTERRKQVFDKMDQDSALLLFSGIELHVSADEYLPFEANRNFFYLTGLRRDHMILMMKKTAKGEMVWKKSNRIRGTGDYRNRRRSFPGFL